MIYQWKCAKCKIKVDVNRKVQDIEIPPQKHESYQSNCEHQWERVILASPFTLKGNCWAKDGYTK